MENIKEGRQFKLSHRENLFALTCSYRHAYDITQTVMEVYWLLSPEYFCVLYNKKMENFVM